MPDNYTRVRTDTEHLPGPGDDDDPDVFVRIRSVEAVHVRLLHFDGERVAPGRPVQRDQSDASGEDLVLDAGLIRGLGGCLL